MKRQRMEREIEGENLLTHTHAVAYMCGDTEQGIRSILYMVNAAEQM